MEDQQTHLPDEPAVGGRHDGQRLRKIMDAKQVGIQEFADLYLQKSKAVAYAFLRKAVFTREELAMVCYLFDCTAEEFDYEKSLLLTGANRMRLEGLFNNVAGFHSMALSDTEAGGGKSFIDAYFKDLTDYTCKAEHTLRIFHYLSKNKNQYRPNVHDHIKTYYAAVENRLATTTDIRYTRFFALPIQFSEQSHEPAEGRTAHLPAVPSEDQVLEKALEIMLPETIRHLAHCLDRFESRFSLYAIYIPPRLNSFTIVDDRYVISEYDRINRYRKVSHDLMFVDQINSVESNDPIAMLLKSNNRDLDNLTINVDSQLRPPVQLEKILAVILNKYQQKEVELEDKKTELQDARAVVQGHLFNDINMDTLEKLNAIKEQIALLEEELKDWDEKKKQVFAVIQSAHS